MKPPGDDPPAPHAPRPDRSGAPFFWFAVAFLVGVVAVIGGLSAVSRRASSPGPAAAPSPPPVTDAARPGSGQGPSGLGPGGGGR